MKIKLFLILVVAGFLGRLSAGGAPAIVFAGSVHTPLGQAVLSNTASGLLITNLGVSGADGVSIAVGLTPGYMVFFELPDPLAPGAQVTVASQGLADLGSNTVPSAAAVAFTKLPDGTMQVSSTYSAQPVSSYWVSLSLTSAPVTSGSTCVSNGAALIVRSPTGMPGSSTACVSWPKNSKTNVIGQMITYSPPVVISIPGGGTYTADKVTITYNCSPYFAPNSSWTNLAITASGLPSVQITKELLVAFEVPVAAAGASLLNVMSNDVAVTNLGPSGSDGITFHLSDGPPAELASRFRAELAPVTLATNGQVFSLRATGIVSGAHTSFLGEATFTSSSTNVQVAANFSALGATATRVEVYSNGMFVGQTLVSNALAGSLAGSPPITGFGEPGRFLPCFIVEFAAPFTFAVNDTNAQIFSGDELRLLAHAPSNDVLTLTDFTVTAGGVPGLTVEFASQSPCVTAPAGLVGWWGGDGQALDLSGRGNHGIPTGAVQYAWGRVAHTFCFDNANYVFVPDPPDDSLDFSTNDFSLCAWVQTTNPATATIVDKRQDLGGISKGWRLLINPAGQLVLQLGDGVTLQDFAGTGPGLADGSWHFVAAAVDRLAGQVRLFADGRAVGALAVPADFHDVGSTMELRLGRETIFTPAPLLGRVDELEVFNRALDAAEFEGIRLAASAGQCKCLPPPPTLASWWTADNHLLDLAGGTYDDGVPTNVTFAPGVVEQAFCFTDAGSSVVEAPSSDELNFSDNVPLSLTAWIKTSAGGAPVILDKRGGTVVLPRGYSLLLDNGKLGFQLARGAGSPPSFSFIADASSPSLNDGRWHFVTATLDRAAQTVKLYADGLLVLSADTAAYEGDLSSSEPLRIGLRSASQGGGAGFGGCLDEIQIFRRALGHGEVLAIFNAGDLGQCKPPCDSACLLLTCPSDITAITISNTAPVTFAASGSGTCTNLVQTICTPPPGLFPMGTTRVTCTVRDDLRHCLNCSFKVTVLPDFTPPLITSATVTNGSFVIQWTGAGSLESSANLVNWTTISNASNPYVTAPVDPYRFYRIRQ